jgi:hypothetical protein
MPPGHRSAGRTESQHSGRTGHLLAYCRSAIRCGIADAFDRHSLLFSGMPRLAAMNWGRILPGSQVFFLIEPVLGGLCWCLLAVVGEWYRRVRNSNHMEANQRSSGFKVRSGWCQDICSLLSKKMV